MSENDQTTFKQLINMIDPLRQQYPIPTLKIDIDSETAFKEDSLESVSREDPKAKRNLCINGKPCSSTTNPTIGTAWAFSLDGKDVLGPRDMTEESIVIFEIDSRQWGALVQPDKDLNVSVWIQS